MRLTTTNAVEINRREVVPRQVFTIYDCLFISSSELAKGELLGYRDVRRTCGREMSVRQLFSLCLL